MDWGSTAPHSHGALFLRDLGQERFYRALAEATWKWRDWPGGQDFLPGQAGLAL